jgi:uncharacterized small protein (DUF1192 family)
MQKDDKAQAHENDAETELEMSVTAATNQRITANRSDIAREEAENSFWDCVRPDESPAGDRTKAAGILVSGVEAVRARCVKVSCGWVPRSALVVIDGPTRGLLDS